MKSARKGIQGIRASGGRRSRIAQAALGAVLVLGMAAPARALQIIEAADHAELTAEISADAVNRIALEGDRVTRVIQAPGGFTVEHDPVRGDLYLHPGAAPGGPAGEPGIGAAPAHTLYLGTERGFTYRLTLAAVPRDPAQILIRNDAAANDLPARVTELAGYVEDLVELIRAVAKRAPLAGYAIVPGPAQEDAPAVGLVEAWRGREYTVRVFRLADDAVSDAAAIGERAGPDVAAAWVSGEARGVGGGRLAVVVERAGGAP